MAKTEIHSDRYRTMATKMSGTYTECTARLTIGDMRNLWASSLKSRAGDGPKVCILIRMQSNFSNNDPTSVNWLRQNI